MFLTYWYCRVCELMGLARILSLTIGGALYLGSYLTLVPNLGAVGKLDVENLKTILCKTRIVATFGRRVLGDEAKLLSAIGRD